MNRVQIEGQDLGETAAVPPTIHLAERWRRLGHRQGVCWDGVARGHQSPESGGDDDFDVRGALRPSFLGDAHVHVTLEATVRRKESTGTHGPCRALVKDFLPVPFELRSDRGGKGGPRPAALLGGGPTPPLPGGG